MRKLVYMSIVFTALAFFASCGDDNYYYITEVVENSDSDSISSDDGPKNNASTLDSIGTDAKPTDWSCIATMDPTRYMTLTMDANGVPVGISSDDMLAAFVGDECRGVTTPYTDVDGVTRFSMVIIGSSESSENGTKTTELVELRYYSSLKHRIYLADKFVFQPGDILGDVLSSYKPTWH